MTPAQMHNNLFLLGSVGGALLVETIAWRLAPRLLAAVAFVPLFARRVALGARVRARLTVADGPASYRAAPSGAVDWARLPGAHRFERDGVRFTLDPSRARLVARLPFAPHWFSFGGVAVVVLRAEGDAVVVEARALPWLTLASGAFFGALLALVARDGPWPLGALFVGLFFAFNGLAAWRTRRVFGPLVGGGVDELAARLAD